MNDLNKKIEEITQEISIKPSIDLYKKRAELYNQLEYFELSIKDYDKIIYLDSEDSEAYYNRACEWYNLHIYILGENIDKDVIKENTIRYLEKAISLKEDYRYYYRIAEIYFNILDNSDLALQNCMKANEIKPNSINILKLLGQIYNDLELYNEAINCYNSIPDNKRNSDIYFFRGITNYNIFKDGIESIQLDEVLDDLDKAISLDEDNIYLYLKKAKIIYNELSDAKNTILCYKKVIKINKYNEEANEWLANYYYDNDKFKEALKYSKNYLEINSNNIDMYFQHAECSYEVGQYKEALSCYKYILEKWEDSRVYDYIGDVYLKMGHYEKSIENYKKFLELNPDAKGVHYRLGVAYKENGNKENALIELNKALQLLPSNQMIIDLINEIEIN